MTLLEIKLTLKEILGNYGLEQKAITDQASFVNDLGFDSLDFAELILTLEIQFNISLPFHSIEKDGHNIEALALIIKKEIQNKKSITS